LLVNPDVILSHITIEESKKARRSDHF